MLGGLAKVPRVKTTRVRTDLSIRSKFSLIHAFN
jgi:hypothetical protein